MMNQASTFAPRALPPFAMGSIIALLILATGCTTVRQEFPGREPGQVWAAMEAVARTPEYSDWRVTANEVWIDPEQARLEIFRITEREHRRPGSKPRYERREWRFQVVLEESDPPAATFISRGGAVPAHASREGQAFFADVREVLQGETLAGVVMPDSTSQDADGASPDNAGDDPDELVEP